MKNEILRNLSYGMYAIGVKGKENASACIVNTVFQVTSSPQLIAVSMNHSNYSHDCIIEHGIFTVSVLSEDTPGTVIGALTIGVINNGMNLMNVPYFYQMVVKGLVILVAVYFDVRNKRKRS